jgi:hypothetical protein
MAAIPEARVPKSTEKIDVSPAPRRKPWQAPRFIVSDVGATQNSSHHPTEDNPSYQIS